MKIKTKLFLFFMVSIAALAAVSILLNTLFLERFYLQKNESIFEEAARAIAQEYKQGGDIVEYLRSVDRTQGINCMIAGPDYRIKYSSFPQKGPVLAKGIADLSLQTDETSVDSYAYAIVDTPDYGIRDIAFVMPLDGGDILVLRKPLQVVTQSTGIANQFQFYTALAVLAAGGVAIYLMAGRITRPIAGMTGIAKSISKLDFSRRVNIKSKDELGELGGSINRMADQLSETLKALRRDVERRKQLVRNMSHELKTPVGVIKGYAEGLRYGVAEDAKQTEKYCKVIAEECDRMDGMISELLELSRLESGVFKPEPKDISVCGLMDTVIKRFAPAAAEKGVRLSAQCPQEIAVRTDGGLAERAVGNYVSNAIKHTGGDMRVVVSAEDRDDFVRISVYNTGEPIAEEEQKKLWDVFYMADKARMRESSHGLGLSIVKSIAELLGARYGARNAEGGVEFFIDFLK